MFFCKANTRLFSWRPCRVCHLVALALFDTTSQAMGGLLKRRLTKPFHGNFTPPRFSPSSPHCLRLWLGWSIHPDGVMAKQLVTGCFPDRWSRSPPYWPSLTAAHPLPQVGLSASSGVACPFSQRPVRELISTSGYSVFEVQVGERENPLTLLPVERGGS